MRWWLLFGALLLTAGLGWWVLQVALLPSADRSTAAGYGQFVLAAVGLLVLLVGPIRRGFARPAAPGLDDLADQLALAMRETWVDAANDLRLQHPAPLPVRWRRTGKPVAGPTPAATLVGTDHTQFQPLPGLGRIDGRHLRGGDRDKLHEVYGGLASGRLLIVGGPGAGKTSAAILLLLKALDFRAQATRPEDKQRIPVPVLFTLHGWDPVDTSVDAWLTSQLTEIPVLRGRKQQANALLRGGHIAVFLDGLDEVPARTQALALQALSERATCRLVVTSRTEELLDAAQHHTLTGAVAVELQPLTPSDVADYLVRPLTSPAPSAWRRLASVLTTDPDSSVARALSTPLAVGLLRDTYQPADPVDELCDTTRFPQAEDITNHLLDHAVTAAYTPRLGQPEPPYTPGTARRALAVIAHHLAQHHSHGHPRDLGWWHIRAWVPRPSRIGIRVLVCGVLVTLPIGLGGRWLLGLALGLVCSVSVFDLDETPTRTWRTTRVRWRRPRWREFWIRLPVTLAFSVVLGFVFGVIGGILAVLVSGSLAQFMDAFLPMVLASVGFAPWVAFVESIRSETVNTDATKPITLWRNHYRPGIAVLAVSALVVGTMILIEGGPFSSRQSGVLAILLMMAFAIGLGSPGGSTMIAQIYLAVRFRTPVRLMRFLEDARKRHLMRTIGPYYQFRHATLQDRLAGQFPTLDQDRGEPMGSDPE